MIIALIFLFLGVVVGFVIGAIRGGIVADHKSDRALAALYDMITRFECDLTRVNGTHPKSLITGYIVQAKRAIDRITHTYN